MRRAAFRAGDIGVMFSRFFGVIFRHLFGVLLSHLVKEGGENVAATPARQIRACSLVSEANLCFFSDLMTRRLLRCFPTTASLNADLYDPTQYFSSAGRMPTPAISLGRCCFRCHSLGGGRKSRAGQLRTSHGVYQPAICLLETRTQRNTSAAAYHQQCPSSISYDTPFACKRRMRPASRLWC